MGKIVILSECKNLNQTVQKINIIKKVYYKNSILNNNQMLYLNAEEIETFKDDYKIEFHIVNFDSLSENLKIEALNYLKYLNLKVYFDTTEKSLKYSNNTYLLNDNYDCQHRKIILRILDDKDYIINKESFTTNITCLKEEIIYTLQHNLKDESFKYKDYCGTITDSVEVKGKIIIQNFESLSKTTLQKIKHNNLRLDFLRNSQVLYSVSNIGGELKKDILEFTKNEELQNGYYELIFYKEDRIVQKSNIYNWQGIAEPLTYAGKYYNLQNETISTDITNQPTIKIKFELFGDASHYTIIPDNANVLWQSKLEGSDTWNTEFTKPFRNFENLETTVSLQENIKKKFRIYIDFGQGDCKMISEIPDYIQFVRPQVNLTVSNINIEMLCP